MVKAVDSDEESRMMPAGSNSSRSGEQMRQASGSDSDGSRMHKAAEDNSSQGSFYAGALPADAVPEENEEEGKDGD